MRIQYKKELHHDPEDTWHKKWIRFRNINPNEPMDVPCCKSMRIAMQFGFFSLKRDYKDRVDMKWEARKAEPEAPTMCLSTIDPGESFESNELQYFQINACPFCREEITYECVETKKILHKFKKKTVTEDITEAYTEEEIVK